MNVKLSGGKEITIDLFRISIREFRQLVKSPDQDTEDRILAKVAGITEEELLSLPQPDYRLLVDKFFKAIQEPLADPTSASESTKP